MKLPDPSPCRKCGDTVAHSEACGDVRRDGDSDYYCPPCYGDTLRVVVHWRDADEEGTVVDHGYAGTPDERDFVSVAFPGDHEPFVFDRIGVDGETWLERVHEREVRIAFHEAHHFGSEAPDPSSSVVHVAPEAWDDQYHFRCTRRAKFVWAGRAYAAQVGDQLELADNGTVSLNGVVVEGEDHDG